MDSILEVTEIPYQNGAGRLILHIEAMLDDVLTNAQCPVFLHSALSGKVTWQKRSEFSIERVLAAPGLAPQFVGALLAWGANGILDDGSEQPLEKLIALPGGHNRIGSLALPLEIPGRVWAESCTGSSPNDFPIVWVMTVLDLKAGLVQDARMALSGVWPQSVALAKSAETLIGAALNEMAINQAADAVMAEVAPREDYRGSAEYRKSMAGVMTRRALQACLEGAAA